MRLHVALVLLVATSIESYVSFASADPSPVDSRVIESTEIRLLRAAERIQEDRVPLGAADETLSRAASMSKADGGLLASSSKIQTADEVITGAAVKVNEHLASAAKPVEQVSGVTAKAAEDVTGGAAKATDEVTGGVAKSKDEGADGVAKSKDEVADAPPKTKGELEAEAKAAEAAKTIKEAGGHPSPLKVAFVSLAVIALLGAMTGWALHLANKHEVATPLEPMSGSNLESMSG